VREERNRVDYLHTKVFWFLNVTRTFFVLLYILASLLVSATAAFSTMLNSSTVIKRVGSLGFPFQTPDPFLFCVYHNDNFPIGNKDNMNAPRRGNGADFDWSQPYRMYHGDVIPGFPQHPHRGFETLTLVREGTCDHTDSLGQSGRYGGNGKASDLQWMTAGKGCVHGENFPLLHSDKPNTLKLFQIWINLPAKSKFSEPSFKMYWSENINFLEGENGARCEVSAGSLGSISASGSPPPFSWASDPKNDVGLFLATLPANSKIEIPPATEGAAINRMAYLVEGALEGETSFVGGKCVPGGRGFVDLRADLPVLLENRHESTEMWVLMLQGRPINEPVAQRGPFVMNTDKEIQQAFADYRQTAFGGWPWKEDAVVFPRTQTRFAEYVENGIKRRELAPLTREKIDNLSSKELKNELASRSVSTAGLAEKDDLKQALLKFLQ
jgi:quercetin 2,3-dioxygenase